MFKIKKLNEQNKKKCNITFIIGNGFDIGIGMKSRYEDMYRSYVNSYSVSNVISNFKMELLKRKPYDKWSDFEMGMAEYAQTLSSEDELVECVRDFKGHMVKHLQEENDRIVELISDDSYAGRLLAQLDYSLDWFYSGLIPNDVNQIKKLIDDADVSTKFITFNYTTTLEAFLNIKEKINKTVEHIPIHVHGILDKDVVLGVDNIEQMKDVSFSLTKKGRRAFVKTLFNEQYDKARVETAKGIISQSNIVCIYGFSMGESDRMWIALLKNWLLDNSEHHLVVYQYDETEVASYNYDEIMDIEESKKDELMKKLDINDELILNQIHIPVGRDIFNFTFNKIQGFSTAGSMRTINL